MQLKYLLLICSILSSLASIAQPADSTDQEITENFNGLKDGALKNELSTFSIIAGQTGKAKLDIELERIPLVRCDDDFAFFEKGNFFSVDLIVNISLDQSSLRTITEIQLVYCKYGLWLPQHALEGITAFPLCNGPGKKDAKTNCEVFRSTDRERVYLHMFNTEFEVTWVINKSQYHSRVLDYF